MRKHARGVGLLAVAMLLATGLPSRVMGQSAKVDPAEWKAVVDKGVASLRQRQGEDGSFAPRLAGPGVTAIVVAALLRSGVSIDDPMVAKALAYMTKSVKPDGGIYERRLANYTTSVGIMALAEANKDGRYNAVIEKATAFLKGLQSGDESGDATVGGVGYDGKGRPDLSNTQQFLDALKAAGVPSNDPAVQRAMKFVSRCQNLPGEFNDQPFAAKTSEEDKGGFTYTPFAGNDDPRRTAAGGLRSEGGMTYAGLKSFLYAGVSKDDPRVQAALKWIRAHYTLEENPGQGPRGLYYYYHTFAKAMEALGGGEFADASGKKHNWRQELVAELKKRQQADGSWVNPRDTFGEGSPELATGFALLALSYCK